MAAKRKPKHLKVVNLREHTSKDIVAQFRRMADQLESGEIEHLESLVSVGEIDGEIQLFGWGNVDGLRAIGLLSLGLAQLNKQTLEWMETGE